MIHALHGNFGLPSDWDPSLPPEIPSMAWPLWEIRRRHPGARTLTGFASWFNTQIAALPPDNSRILAGYSLGGRLALHVLLDRPSLWHGALIISAHPGLPAAAGGPARLMQDAVWQERCLHDPWPEVCRAWNAQPVLQTSASAAPPDLSPLEPWRAEIAGAFSDWSLGRQENLLPALSEPALSGLWVAGADDGKFASLARTVTEAVPGFALQLIPAAGHRLLASHPENVRSCLRQLMAQR